MIRAAGICGLLLFSAAALAQSPPPGLKPHPQGVKPAPPPGVGPPPDRSHDRSLGPPPKPRAKPALGPGRVLPLVADYPPANMPEPDPSLAADPRTSGVLRALITGIESDRLDMDKFGPAAAEAVKAGGAALVAFVQAQGPMKTLAYKGALEPINQLVLAGRARRVEEFESVHDKGVLRWRLALTEDGRIARMVTMPAPH